MDTFQRIIVCVVMILMSLTCLISCQQSDNGTVTGELFLYTDILFD